VAAEARYIADADATRGEHFRASLRSRGTFWALLIGVSTTFLVGAYLRDPRVMLAAPAAWTLLVVVLNFTAADKRAESEFFDSLSRSLGLVYLGTRSLPALTPLLGAGDRQRYDHVMCSDVNGDLGNGASMLAHYTYEIRHEHRDENGNYKGTWEPHRFTVLVTDLEPGMTYFRGIYLRRKRGLLEILGHDWLRGRDLMKIELESSAFNEVYDLRIVADQGPLAVRELFSPTLIDWLARHPLAPSLEYRAGTLVVYLPGHVEDGGKLTWFYESSKELAKRLVGEVREAA
jgi:hypothetical protein